MIKRALALSAAVVVLSACNGGDVAVVVNPPPWGVTCTDTSMPIIEANSPAPVDFASWQAMGCPFVYYGNQKAACLTGALDVCTEAVMGWVSEYPDCTVLIIDGTAGFIDARLNVLPDGSIVPCA